MEQDDSYMDKNLSFIFTPDGFRPDISEAAGGWKQEDITRWSKESGLPALYDTGLQAAPKEMTQSARFLYQTAAAFFRQLTELPELELAREQVQVPVPEEMCEELLLSVPFAIGAEYITEGWIRNIFEGLTRIFRREIAGYSGTVELYLTEKNQDLHVPERIFFHLVENKDDADYPFAFLATYATKSDDGKVRHVPLRYALTEYKGKRDKA